jgi:hypothetical protein
MGRSLRRLGCLSALFAATNLATSDQVFAATPLLPSSTAACRLITLATPSLGNHAAVNRAAAQVSRNDRADLTFEVRPSPDGTFTVQAGGTELSVRKTVDESGSWTLEIQTRNDKVVLSVGPQGLNLVRGKKSIAFSLDTATEEQLTDARRLLADSKAVVLFRAASAALEASEDDSGPATSVLIADAIVGALTGDVGAPRRIARHLARHSLSRVRRVGMGTDCYAVWEGRVMSAWSDYTSCIYDFMPWAPLQILCAARWSLMVESYWWTFIACSSLPFK